ncbi:uncharacterized protein J3R85_000364 [Psidium guajava]|nr:uncharacterized protein J3R85_000364 [Psidium guajava]
MSVLNFSQSLYFGVESVIVRRPSLHRGKPFDCNLIAVRHRTFIHDPCTAFPDNVILLQAIQDIFTREVQSLEGVELSYHGITSFLQRSSLNHCHDCEDDRIHEQPGDKEELY